MQRTFPQFAISVTSTSKKQQLNNYFECLKKNFESTRDFAKLSLPQKKNMRVLYINIALQYVITWTFNSRTKYNKVKTSINYKAY